MGILALAADERVSEVKITEDTLTVGLMDGRSISVPLAWYPRLFNATPAQRENWQIAGGGYGIHWPDVDEDLSTEGLLRWASAACQISQSVKAKSRIPFKTALRTHKFSKSVQKSCGENNLPNAGQRLLPFSCEAFHLAPTA